MASILIIDDDEFIRKMMLQILTEAGYQVFEAMNGKEGIGRYRAEPTDLLITDLIMPEKDGIEVIMDLRGEFPEAKIIAMSGGSRYGKADFLKTAKMLGARRILDKPFDLETLLATVKEALDGQ